MRIKKEVMVMTDLLLVGDLSRYCVALGSPSAQVLSAILGADIVEARVAICGTDNTAHTATSTG